MSQTQAKSRPESSAIGGRPAGQAVTCAIAKGTKIDGNFHSAENIRLDGIVVGEIRCDKKLVMGEGSRLEGRVFANDAVIMGQIEGDLTISGVLHLTASAKVKGNISTRQLIVDEGAQYDGQCKAGG